MKRKKLFQVVGIQLLLVSSVYALSLKKNVAPLGKESGAPRSLALAQDGGLLVLMETPAVLVKLGIQGENKWSYHVNGEGVARIRSAASDINNGVILCITRLGGLQNVFDMPSAVVRLDANGHEIARLDSGIAPITGGPFYRVAVCQRWGDGYLVIAKDKKSIQVTGPNGKQLADWTYPGTLIKLREDLSVEWRKEVDLHADVVAPSGGIKILPNGEVAVPGFDRLTIVDTEGNVKAETKTGACRWLQTELPDHRIRMACNDQELAAASVITEFDSSLKVLSKITLGTKNYGLAIVAEMRSGVFGLLGADEHGPFVSTFAAQGGIATSTYRFPSEFPEYASRGGIADCLPIGPSSLVVLRFVDKNSATPTVSWVNMN